MQLLLIIGFVITTGSVWIDSMDSAKRSEVCYDDLGCIVTDFSWFDLTHRPVNLMPLARHIINTTFTLHTRELKPEVKLISNHWFQSGRNQYYHEQSTSFDDYDQLRYVDIHWMIQGVTISANDTSSFKPGSSTKIIAHGFLSDGNEQWLKVGCHRASFWLNPTAVHRF